MSKLWLSDNRTATILASATSLKKEDAYDFHHISSGVASTVNQQQHVVSDSISNCCFGTSFELQLTHLLCSLMGDVSSQARTERQQMKTEKEGQGEEGRKQETDYFPTIRRKKCSLNYQSSKYMGQTIFSNTSLWQIKSNIFKFNTKIVYIFIYSILYFFNQFLNNPIFF